MVAHKGKITIFGYRNPAKSRFLAEKNGSPPGEAFTPRRSLHPPKTLPTTDSNSPLRHCHTHSVAKYVIFPKVLKRFFFSAERRVFFFCGAFSCPSQTVTPHESLTEMKCAGGAVTPHEDNQNKAFFFNFCGAFSCTSQKSAGVLQSDRALSRNVLL